MADGKVIKYDVLAVTRDTSGEIRLKLGDSQTEEGQRADAAWWGSDGFVSMPNEPDDRGACQALYVTEGNNSRCVATKDNRICEQYATLAAGDRAIITDGPAKVLVKKSNDSVTLASENASGLVLHQVAPDTITMQMPGTPGTMIQMTPSRIVLMVNNGGSLILDATGVHLSGNLTEVNSGLVTLGMIAPNVPLVPSINSALIGPTGMAGIPSTKVLIAP